MVPKGLACFVVLVFLPAFLFAQEEGIESAVDYKVTKMKKELKLTEAQAEAIGPVIKEYLIKRGSLLKEIAGEGVVDHKAVHSILMGLKDKENQQLSRILNKDQMKKCSSKEKIMATLNPDSIESSVDQGGIGLSEDGVNANLKF